MTIKIFDFKRSLRLRVVNKMYQKTKDGFELEIVLRIWTHRLSWAYLTSIGIDKAFATGIDVFQIRYLPPMIFMRNIQMV